MRLLVPTTILEPSHRIGAKHIIQFELELGMYGEEDVRLWEYPHQYLYSYFDNIL